MKWARNENSIRVTKKMREEDLEISIKVLVVGNGAVGKSSMIQRYCKGTFTKEYKKTIGVDFLEKTIKYVFLFWLTSLLVTLGKPYHQSDILDISQGKISKY